MSGNSSSLGSGSAAHRLLQRLDDIGHALSPRDDALALLALGSVGPEAGRLDAYSDLDFFVLVRDGAKARYLGALEWLAQAHPIDWHFRNTVDGHKALMRDGVFCEFAIFELGELHSIPYAPGRFVWKRADVDEALARPQVPLPARRDHGVPWPAGEALSNLMIGLARAARGARLAAMRMIQVFAVDLVLELLEALEPAAETTVTAARDPFSIERRAEQRISNAGARLAAMTQGYARNADSALAVLAELKRLVSVPAALEAHIDWLAWQVRQGAAP